MLKKSDCSTDKKLLMLYGLILFAFAALVYLVPYSHDDWAWGCEVGLQRLESNFEAYNGRYFGNYLVLALTRSKILQVIIIAFSAFLMCYLPGLYFGQNTVMLTVFSALLVFLMPKEIFTQTVVWTSGYSNYMPPILTTVIYFTMIKNIFNGTAPEYNKSTPVISAALGFAGALFMEHVTLYNLAISCLIILFVLIKFKKMYLTHVAFSLGSLVGTFVMFSNSAYGLIAGANDAQGGYRSTALSGNLLSMLKDNVETIGEQLFLNNVVILFIISILLVLLATFFVRKSADAWKNKLVLASLFTNLVCLIIIFAKSRYRYWFIAMNSEQSETFTLLFMTAVMILYCLAVAVIVVLCVKDGNTMFKMLLVLVSVPVVTVPLAVVSPVSSRCFLPHYFLLMIFCVVLIGYLQKEMKFTFTVNKMVLLSMSAVTVASCIFMFSIYATIHSYAERRDEYIQKQISDGKTVVKVCEIPNSTYIYLGTPTEELWTERFKLFYGLDKDLEFEILHYEEFDAWAKKYDAKEAD